jgi:SAM-dependent methyltransferase
MSTPSSDKVFAGSIPELYDTYLVPLLFEPYARDLAQRLARLPLSRVLEVAAGTGVVTRALTATLEDTVSIVATDLNQTMIDQAIAHGTHREVTWRQADVMALPFGNAAFDAVVCQFGVMFFPDKPAAFAEIRRTLKPGGLFLFNVWDRIEENEFADVVTNALELLFPDEPPRFLERTPHGYHDQDTITRDLAAAGFSAPPAFHTLAARSRAASCEHPPIGYCQGTPLRNEIEARDASRLAEATAVAAEAIAKRFGRAAVDGKIQGIVVAITK